LIISDFILRFFLLQLSMRYCYLQKCIFVYLFCEN